VAGAKQLKVGLRVADLDASCALYVKLGFKQIPHPDQPKLRYLTFGHTWLNLSDRSAHGYHKRRTRRSGNVRPAWQRFRLWPCRPPTSTPRTPSGNEKACESPSNRRMPSTPASSTVSTQTAMSLCSNSSTRCPDRQLPAEHVATAHRRLWSSRSRILHRHSEDLIFGVQVEVLSASVSVPLPGLTVMPMGGSPLIWVMWVSLP
jgi:hypothetical protein